MKAHWRWAIVFVLLMSCSACQREHVLRGRVIDYDSGAPVANARLTARQSGWGVSDGSLVWDKSYDYRVVSDARGYFALSYGHGSAAHLWVTAEGYQRLVHWFEPGEILDLPLKKLIADYSAHESGFLAFGQYRGEGFYGWDFVTCRQTDDPAQADLLPLEVGPDQRDQVVLTASGQGGFVCRSLSELGVPAQPLSYSDVAPPAGYRRQVRLDFSRDEGGICFVRTRDGRHFAKFAYTPQSFSSRARADLQRDVMFRFVYNRSGGRELPFQEEGPNPTCGDPWGEK